MTFRFRFQQPELTDAFVATDSFSSYYLYNFIESARDFLRATKASTRSQWQIEALDLLLKIADDPVKELFYLFSSYGNYVKSWKFGGTQLKPPYIDNLDKNYVLLDMYARKMIFLKKHKYYFTFKNIVEKLISEKDEAYERLEDEDLYYEDDD